MSASFFFYDLETSGFNSRTARIMQFAGQRTSLQLEPIGEPVNVLIKLTSDVLPDPGAVLVTGITPQKTIEDGVTESEFLKLFYEQVASPGTIFVGYNSVRFDDEFMRHLMWRNFYDAYAWQWQDGASRWDLLDVVRMTRALRPDGINWPNDPGGKAANRLELLTRANHIEHTGAHDALADVNATLELAKLLRSKQPEIFDYLLKMRDKKLVAELVNSGQPFVYTSGKYASEFEKTSVAIKLADVQSGALVYDLRFDPSEYTSLAPKELAKRWVYTKDENAAPRLPVKTMKFNRCPAIAPLGVLDSASQKRLTLDLKTVEANRKKLLATSGFSKKILAALEIMDKRRASSRPAEAETLLYDGFIEGTDKQALASIQAASADTIVSLAPAFKDKRLAQIWPRYLARNYPSLLSSEQQADWESYRRDKLTSGGDTSPLAAYFNELARLAKTSLTHQQQFLLGELQLYGESIMPDVS